MSLSSERGRAFEVQVQKLTRRLLKLDIKRDLQSGAGIHKADVRDRYGQMPLFIECKDHETIKPKAWWREAAQKAVVGQAPVVVFPDQEETLCVMRYSDLLNLVREGMDWRQTVDDLRNPPRFGPPVVVNEADIVDMETIAHRHLTDANGYCQVKGCQYSRGYRKPKVKQGVRK